MVLDLRSKLDLMSQTLKNKEASTKEVISKDAAKLGTQITNKDGSHVEFKHLANNVDSSIDLASVAKWSGLKNVPKSLTQCLFIDCETTGLSTSSGTIAFLIGLGYFNDSGFLVEQHLIRDYYEEPSLLSSIKELIDSKEFIVTFNGKCYDWPLIQTRFIINRMRVKNFENSHIDLIHPSRRIWRTMLPNCRLTTIEENIFNIKRQDDIDGSQIPDAYLEFMENGKTSLIDKIIEHNRLDIISLTLLMRRIDSIHKNPCRDGNYKMLLNMCKVFEREDYCYTERLYNDILLSNADDWIKTEAAERLAIIYKKSGSLGKAVNLWTNIANRKNSMRVSPLIELAKFYEHKKKDFEYALNYTQAALRILTSLDHDSKILSEVEYRKNRLLKKIGV